jgi:hypothetical protein
MGWELNRRIHSPLTVSATTWPRIGVVLVLLGSCSSHVSAEAGECINLWNDGGPHGIVATEGYTVADVTPGENKAGQWGCGFLFHSHPGDPWRFYGITMEDGGFGNWDTVTGSSWGTDSPEASNVVTVGVRSEGSLNETSAD